MDSGFHFPKNQLNWMDVGPDDVALTTDGKVAMGSDGKFHIIDKEGREEDPCTHTADRISDQ